MTEKHSSVTPAIGQLAGYLKHRPGCASGWRASTGSSQIGPCDCGLDGCLKAVLAASGETPAPPTPPPIDDDQLDELRRQIEEFGYCNCGHGDCEVTLTAGIKGWLLDLLNGDIALLPAHATPEPTPPKHACPTVPCPMCDTDEYESAGMEPTPPSTAETPEAARSAANFALRFAAQSRHTEAVADCPHCTLAFLAKWTLKVLGPEPVKDEDLLGEVYEAMHGPVSLPALPDDDQYVVGHNNVSPSSEPLRIPTVQPVALPASPATSIPVPDWPAVQPPRVDCLQLRTADD